MVNGIGFSTRERESWTITYSVLPVIKTSSTVVVGFLDKHYGFKSVTTHILLDTGLEVILQFVPNLASTEEVLLIFERKILSRI